MALQSAYKQFLAAPSASLLAEDASLHYITTLVTLHGASGVVKHLSSQSHELKVKEQKFLDVIEAPDALAVEVHTTMEFQTGGGAYLPSLDDNFLADRTVTFPIIHIVSFDANGKITQIRQNWDQGSLLKLIDVIGKTGRNWPIRDGKDQIKLIVSSVKAAGKTPVDPARNSDAQAEMIRSRGNSTNVTRDPHASLSLFAPREKTVHEDLPAGIAPRASAKPLQRDYHDLFVGNDSDQSQDTPMRTPVARLRSESPAKAAAAKGGAGRNYGPSRLFDTELDASSPDKIHGQDKFYQPNPQKFQHFDMADVSEEKEEMARPLVAKTTKHGSQWNFDDFNTPQKAIPSKVLRTNEVRHWGNSDDEVVDSPEKMKKVDKPRKDAETHFEFQDDGTPEGGRRLIGRPRGPGQTNGLSLYQDILFGEEEGAAMEQPKTVHGLANTKDRRKDFDPHFTMTDDSPASKPAPERISEDRAKAVKMMDANWSTYDQSPGQKENVPASPSTRRPNTGNRPLSEATNISNRYEHPRGIATSGDGMGGKKVEATNAMSHRNDNTRGIATGGDGMGGKKGQGRQWGFGDDSDGEEDGGANKPSKFRTGKTHGKNASSAGGDFWDF